MLVAFVFPLVPLLLGREDAWRRVLGCDRQTLLVFVDDFLDWNANRGLCVFDRHFDLAIAI